MALVECPECNKPSSELATACFTCGYPFNSTVLTQLKPWSNSQSKGALAQVEFPAERFLELQYSSLRREIEQCKSRLFQIAVGGAIVVPAAQYIADVHRIGSITLALPLLVVILVLLFLSENHAIMRCGSYLLQHVEPLVPGVVCWEEWLHSSHQSRLRSVDRLVVLAFSVLAGVYFLVSVTMAANFARDQFGQQGQYLVAGLYLGLGVVLGALVYWQSQTNTQADTAGQQGTTRMRNRG